MTATGPTMTISHDDAHMILTAIEGWLDELARQLTLPDPDKTRRPQIRSDIRRLTKLQQRLNDFWWRTAR